MDAILTVSDVYRKPKSEIINRTKAAPLAKNAAIRQTQNPRRLYGTRNILCLPVNVHPEKCGSMILKITPNRTNPPKVSTILRPKGIPGPPRRHKGLWNYWHVAGTSVPWPGPAKHVVVFPMRTASASVTMYWWGHGAVVVRVGWLQVYWFAPQNTT